MLAVQASHHRIIAVVVVLVAVVQAWFPFLPDAPVIRRSGPTVADGSWSFDGSDALIGPGGMPWLSTALAARAVEVDLEARTDDGDQDGPARLLALSASVYSGDLSVGQDGADLVVRVRRPGSDELGLPAVVVPGVFATPQWRRIEVSVAAESLQVRVDDAVQAELTVDGDITATWDPAMRTALGDEWRGNRGWRGELRRAEVRTGTTTVDLLGDGTLSPAADIVAKARTDGADDPVPNDSPVLVIARLVAWTMLGFVVSRARPRAATVAALAVLPFVLTFGKLFVAHRDPALSDAIIGLLGVFAGAWLERRRRARAVAEPTPPQPVG